ncbi:hypothetical protein [Actinoplanes sp. RD1]|uniref:hypothetical protein n=1 Tax=Actinoplanes sp. RD1 TaxID=3064538 RepID=UPI0027427958|nr:hypothetical protein [Actinoplanes sp. RD1]
MREEGAAVRRRCAILVRRLTRATGLPAPFELAAFLAAYSKHFSGRPIELLALSPDEMPPGVCGLWLAMGGRDVIGFPAGAARTHRDHIVLHEVGHMLAGHRGVLDPSGPAALLPDLDPEMVRAVLGRSVYNDVQEREAELIASLILQRSLSRPPARPGSDDPVVERLRRALDD